MARQPKAMQRYQRGRSKKLIIAASDALRADLDAVRAMFEDKVAQRVSYPVVIWRALRVLQDHLQHVSSIAERDALIDLIARGEVIERHRPPDAPILVIRLSWTGLLPTETTEPVLEASAA